MKIRQGFVSNSSSSSFIMFGIQLKEPFTDEQYELLEKTGLDMIAEDDGFKTPVIGILYDFDECSSIDYAEYSALPLIFEKIKQCFPNIELKDFKIYYGTRCC